MPTTSTVSGSAPPDGRSIRGRRVAASALAMIVGLGAIRVTLGGQEFAVRAVSSRPDTVSNGDVLVEVSPAIRSKWRVELNGRDVTREFRPSAISGKPVALLTGLKLGTNTLEIRVDGTLRSQLALVSHPRGGPIFSGPHQYPFLCQTVANGLDPATDADCNAPTVVRYYYKSTRPPQASDGVSEAVPGSLGPGFKVYNLGGPPPTDVAQTVTSDGRTVSYIVRRETGTINRAVYDIQLLHEPGRPLPTPWTGPTPGWNGRLLYFFGGGCGAGYRQGSLYEVTSIGTAEEPIVAQGYAFATSTLNVFGNNCNDNLSAETLAMVKEHFIKEYGVPVHTIGWGGSGGAMQVHLIAQNYPRLLDGIIADHSFPDVASTAQSFMDCSLLEHAFQTSKQRWTDTQKTAVSGFATWRTCVTGWSANVYVDPRNCDRSIPKTLIYDRSVNPRGVRCDIYDNEINVFGRDPQTGFARRPLDNVGVQYGLVAFNRGQIDAEQFVELNERIGGYDADLNTIPLRTAVDVETLRIAYGRGLLLTGGGGLGEIPIIDWRHYSDDLADIHDRFRSFVTRARLTVANGSADNQVIRVDPRYDFALLLGRNVDALVASRARDHVRQIDRWLDNVGADTSSGTQLERVSRNKPAGLVDGCWATDGEAIAERATYGGRGRCNEMYPAHGDPRIAAGGPLTDDVLKCVAKPLNPADYIQPLDAFQLERLRAAFPTGVCDYGRPGVSQQVTQATWQSYRDGAQAP